MVFISGVAIMSGSWPAPSPGRDEDRGGRGGVVVLANADGSGEAEGPAGSLPAWAGATSLYVSGGSIELVRRGERQPEPGDLGRCQLPDGDGGGDGWLIWTEGARCSSRARVRCQAL